MNRGRWRSRIDGAVLLAGLAVTGCNSPKPHERLNAPPQAASRPVGSQHQAFYRAMSDNALLSEMAMYDMHFLPHQPLLSKAGEARVKRYADLLRETGGALAYEPRETNEALDKARLVSIRKCLAEAGSAGSKITVRIGMDGAAGMDAKQAVAARQMGTVISPPTASGGGSTSGGASGAGSSASGATSGSGGGVKE